MERTYTSLLVILVCIRVTSPVLISHGASITTLDVREDFFYTVPIPSFLFHGTSYTTINIHENGVLTFDDIPFGGEIADYTIDDTWIAPYGADVGGGIYGNISHETFGPADTTPTQFVSSAVDSIFTGESFVPSSMFVVTWQDVRLYPAPINTEESTFQGVLTTDGSKSYILFLYDKLEWTSGVVGISAGNSVDIYEVCQSTTYDAKFLTLRSQSTCSMAGVLVFRVDQTTWQQAGNECTAVYPPVDCTTSSDTADMNRNQRCAA